PNILKLADGLKAIGERHNATAGQVAIAWDLAQGDDIIPIPGTKKAKYAIENAEAVKVTLTPDELKEVRAIAAQADASNGSRYPDALQQVLFADTPE
ncbi:aldo/keto reductase, partial [Bacillus bingmayongensis]|nr:aldo/keto reductase [Bacillus bingmayongensis]